MSETPRNHADDPYTPAVPPLPGYHPTAHEAQPLEGTVHPSSSAPMYPQPPAPEWPRPQQAAAQQPAGPQVPQAPQPPQGPQGYYFSAEQPPAGSHGGSQTGSPMGPPVVPPLPPTGDGAYPAGDAGDGGEPGAPRKRSRRPLALVAAVAVLSALAGGVAGGLISNTTSDHASYSTNAVVTGDKSSSAGDTAAIAKAVSPAVVQIEVDSSSSQDIGTGQILTSSGQILTNFHVISDAVNGNGGTIKVTLNDGKTAAGSIVATDAKLDVAVIKISGYTNLPTVSLGSSGQVAVGDQVTAIGNPDGLTGTVTSGIVSALNRPVTVDVSPSTVQSNGGFGLPFWQGDSGRNSQPSSGQQASYNAIQTDASLNPGNSGGPLLNAQGQVIGINASMYSSSGSDSSGGQAGSVGLGFAIPIDAVKQVLPQLQSGQSISS
ncbi:S1C family serine protease [Streptacidiphilus fuscans]|uniref:Trypsin-like peptidase domain-containing protein n=1 Tax=Streptacidiphilus fuscans TaxID=2789292 RepID=A0A931B8T1_9ACTN|nr:trypsin-like peptidase domain-containing protein [Streptacidiphilus fuscans]MBF9072298.1 trypsin-like peptidase domain-containing protein [Streptacidiphilus fuscans]